MVFDAVYPCPNLFQVPTPVSQVLVLLGAAMSLFHYARLKHKNSDVQHPCRLVTEGGLWPWVRHPMYLGDILMFAGFWTFLTSPLTLPVLLLGYIAMVKQVDVEERFLAEQFRASFLVWQSQTGKLLPTKLFTKAQSSDDQL